MNYRMSLVVALVFASIALAQSEPAAPPAPRVADARVVVISIDGMRPDLMLAADCPNLRELMKRGSYTMWAQTTPVGITLPSHVSMMTGRTVERHGIYWNSNKIPDGVEYRYPQSPTLFQLAHEAGLTTAMSAGKIKFITLARPGTVDKLSLPAEDYRNDEQTTDAAVTFIDEFQPRVLMVHLGDTDGSGHHDGWGSHEQRAVIEKADKCVGRVLAALEQAGVLDRTLIIVSADHGGWWKTHNGGDPRGLHIPWIAVGPGVRADYDLTLEKELAVHTEDTFATACDFLGLAVAKCEGKPVALIYGEEEK